jgi:putative ABC transport system permease protein
MKTMRSVLSSLKRSPLKSTLTLLTVGLGVGVLIVALSTSFTFSRLMKTQLESQGIVMMVSNAEVSETTGQVEPVRPGQFDEDVLSVLRSDIEGVEAVSPVGNVPWNELVAGGATYRIRTALAVDDGYADVMSLDLVAGSFLTAEDVKAGAKRVVISESLATVLFGSAEAALGQTLRSPASGTPTASGTQGTDQSQPRGPVMAALTVAGVFKDVGELQRQSCGVGDLLVPYTSMLSQGANVQMAVRSSLSTLAILVRGTTVATVEAQARQALAARYGDDVSVAVWEGTPRGETTTLADARSTVRTFTLVVNLLGFMILVTGSIGILSIMLVEVLGRGREIAIERALGASGRNIASAYFARSAALASLSAIVGVAFSLALGAPLRALVLPIFAGVSAADLGSSVVTPAALAIGVGTALLVGGVFGTFPVIPALRANLAEGMREAA